MNRTRRVAILGLALLAISSQPVLAQKQYIGYVYPAGGRQGTTFQIRLGGQSLLYTSGLVVSGKGVSVRLIDYYRPLNNQEMNLLRQQLKVLQKPGTTLSDAMTAKMAWFELPARQEPPVVEGVLCLSCGRLNPPGARVCSVCNAPLRRSKKGGPAARPVGPPKTEKELAKRNLIERIRRIFAEDERNPAVRAHTELVFAEVTVAPDAPPGRREIRVITRTGISNAIPFYIGQVPEVTRKPMKTCRKPVLGKESQAQRRRPADEVESRVPVPCTMNGQIAAGEVNRYRFEAKAGQHLVIATRARDLVPYVADGVPGWFQAVLRLHDAKGRELAYNDDFRFNPDPVLFFDVPEDGEYILTIHDALFRGRESFTYRITIGAMPYVTGIFPLGGRAGQPVKIEMSGWNLEKTTLAPPPRDAGPGRYRIAAVNGRLASNAVPFELDTLPECLDRESNNDPSTAQPVKPPVIVNGRADRPGDWDVFVVEGKAGETLVAEVRARRLGSPYDSFVKITDADGRILALNDDHFDAASGLNTDHADSYLMVKLPSNGRYFIHIGDTRRHAGEAHAYRLRISAPRPDFELRVTPSRLCLRSRGSVAATVFAIRRDGFTGPIKVRFKDLPEGVVSNGVTLGAGKETTRLSLKTTLQEMAKPVDVTVVGTAKAGDREIVRKAVAAEDRMQAFLWRHLLTAETLPLLVYNPGYRPPALRERPPIRDDQRPKKSKRDLRQRQLGWYMRSIENLYQQWFLTDDFANRQIAALEARLIQ
jgi:hypothetical protein